MGMGTDQRSAVDFNQIPFIQAVMEHLAEAPTTGGSSGALTYGYFYYDTTLGTPRVYTPSGWVQMTQALKKEVFIFGDGINSSYNLVHNLNTRDLTYTVRLTEVPYSAVSIDVDFTDLNYVTVYSDEVLSSNLLTVTLIG